MYFFGIQPSTKAEVIGEKQGASGENKVVSYYGDDGKIHRLRLEGESQPGRANQMEEAARQQQRQDAAASLGSAARELTSS